MAAAYVVSLPVGRETAGVRVFPEQVTPAVAPAVSPQGAPVSLRAANSPMGLDPVSYRLVLTQLAWLSALLVGVSLPLTRLRLNRRR